MGADSGVADHGEPGVIFPLLSRFGVSLLAIIAYVAVWKLADPSFYLFLILGTYAVLGGFAVVQVVRAVRMDRWTRKVGAIGIVPGFAVTIFLGLRPRTGCLDFGPCASGLTPHVLWLALGVLLVAGALTLGAD